MSSLRSFTRYIEKVYGVMTWLQQVEDGRRGAVIPLGSIVQALVYGTSLGWGSIHAIERECRGGRLHHRVGSIGDDTFRYALDRVESEACERILIQAAKVLKRNGVLRQGLFRSQVVVVLDGIEVSQSKRRHCPRCLQRQIITHGKQETQWYHRVVVCCVVGGAFPIPIGLEFMERGEDEVACGERLLRRLVAALGRRFMDIVVGDALYCRPGFFATCESLGLQPVSILKDNQSSLLQEASWQKEQCEPVRVLSDGKTTTTVWDLPQVLWETADRDVRIVWAEREPTEEESRRRIFVLPVSSGDLPVERAYLIGCHRWDIDSTLFMVMKQYWHLKHVTLHRENAYKNLLHIRFLAYLLVHLLYHLHINARRNVTIPYVIMIVQHLNDSLLREAWKIDSS